MSPELSFRAPGERHAVIEEKCPSSESKHYRKPCRETVAWHVPKQAADYRQLPPHGKANTGPLEMK